MALSDLPRLVDELNGFPALCKALETSSCSVAIDGLAGPAKPFVIARLFSKLQRTLLMVTYQQEQAQRLCDDIIRYGAPAEQVAALPPSSPLFLEGDLTDYRVLGERIAALNLLASETPAIIIGTMEAILQRTTPPATLLSPRITLRVHDTINLDQLLHQLVAVGYEPANTVTRPAEFSRRGGILDVFPCGNDSPVRIELFGDEIETIRPFDVASQRSIRKEALVEINPARELLYDAERAKTARKRILAAYQERKATLTAEQNRDAIERLAERVDTDYALLQQTVYFDRLEQYFPYLYPEQVCALDYLNEQGILILDEPDQVREHWNRFTTDVHSTCDRQWVRGERLDNQINLCSDEVFTQAMQSRRLLALSLLGRTLEGIEFQQRLSLHSAPMDTYRGRMPTLGDEIGIWLANDCRVQVVTEQPQRVREIFTEINLPLRPKTERIGKASGLYVTEGRVRAGFKITDLHFYLLTDAELFGSARPIVARKRIAGGVAVSSVLDLKERDFVVHIHHGIGIYRGMTKRKGDGDNLRDYIVVEYQGGDKLYIPADQIDRIQRYVGADGSPPTINKIGGQEWQTATRKVKKQAREIAAELIKLYAARQQASRLSHGEDTVWQVEMEEAFPYSETRDQLRAIKDVKADLESNQPMDRLICGDVGFGKTEVALRAAFKVVTGGKQVAVLCPTTVLAAQHLNTFTNRLAAYPLKIDLLSRFRSPKEQAKTVRGLADGTVDILVGTHRLLSKDIVFKDLGLLIVDEEQRFGVAHKERLKQLRTQVDVLTLSATPIPRTMSMALAGLRDMSLIEDPPEGRIPVLTYVREYDDDLVRDAILRELERDGQVYFVHNRVESIYHVVEHLRKIVPDARFEVGHGQMSEDELERVMMNFYTHKYDILVSTTIIENGLDVSNCNTILIDNADHLGLAQLYQLRGRVGRSSRQAYAYLFYRKNKKLTEVAEQRLSAMREFAALGSGYKVAMRDMEIRGAGNLLGAAQSGAMISVGFDMYFQILSQAVQELRGEEVTEDILPPADLPITAFIPSDYIPSEAERIYFYKRMSGVRNIKDVEDLQEELEDRFGDPPKPVWTALAVLRLRLRCKAVGIASIKGEGTSVSIRFAPNVRLTPEAVRLLTFAFKQFKFTPDGVVVPLNSTKVLTEVEETITVLERALSGDTGKLAIRAGKKHTR